MYKRLWLKVKGLGGLCQGFGVFLGIKSSSLVVKEFSHIVGWTWCLLRAQNSLRLHKQYIWRGDADDNIQISAKIKQSRKVGMRYCL